MQKPGPEENECLPPHMRILWHPVLGARPYLGNKRKGAAFVMRYARIKNYDIANGSGVRVSLFVSGCRRHCPGCFSPETWDFDYGEKFTLETEKQIIDSLKPDYIAGLSILGGEPLESKAELLPFLKKVKEAYKDKEIWLFTGYTWSEIKQLMEQDSTVKELLSYVDVLKAGPFIESEAQAGLVFKGSKNQQLIDLRKTREKGQVILWEKMKV